jgi:DNA-binding NtrC family response regulator
MIKNLDSNLIDEMINEIKGGKSTSTKNQEIDTFTRKFHDNQLYKKILKKNLKNVVMLIEYYNDSDLIEENMKHKGYFVNSFANQELAENRIRAHNPDIVIIDSLSNKFDGYEVAKKAKQLYPNTIFISIIHSRQVNMIDMERFSEIFDYFLILPLNTEKLEMFPKVHIITAKERLRNKVRLVQNINRLKLPNIQ